MKRKILLFSMFLACTFSVFAQKQTVSGVVKDSFLGETVVGANVVVKGTQTGTSTDIEGKFTLQLDKGNYTLLVSFVGNTPVSQDIVVGDKPLNLTFKMEALTLEGVSIVGDVAGRGKPRLLLQPCFLQKLKSGSQAKISRCC
jgi:hypothetical protein